MHAEVKAKMMQLVGEGGGEQVHRPLDFEVKAKMIQLVGEGGGEQVHRPLDLELHVGEHVEAIPLGIELHG